MFIELILLRTHNDLLVIKWILFIFVLIETNCYAIINNNI
jgi:hypothetical protein